MTITEKEKATLQYYNIHAEDWRAAHCVNSQSFWSDEITKFHHLLPSGKILEVGSGSGREAARLIQLGYDYSGIDASEGLLETARRDNPSGMFFHQNVYDLTFPTNTFDGFWTAATLLHIPKDRMGEALKSIQRVVKPEGLGFISLRKGQGESVDQKTGRFFSYFTIEEFNQILLKNSITVINSGEKEQANRNITWLTFFVKNES